MIGHASSLLKHGSRVRFPLSRLPKPVIEQRQHSGSVNVGVGAAVGFASGADGARHPFSKGPVLMLAAAAATATGIAATSSVASCDERPATSPKEESVKSLHLWPNGVDEAEVDTLVEEVLKDPNINSPLIPDVIERQLYKSTIQLTMNLAYYMVGSIDGMEFLAHKMHVTRKNRLDDRALSPSPGISGEGINEEILEEVAERLLQNKAINLQLVPDAIEKQVYVNCLKVFFRIFTLISQSICITLCGHQIRLQLEPMDTNRAIEKALTTSSLSDIDMDRMYKFAREAGINDEQLTDVSWWDKIFIRRELLAHLHASLYGLMLGIADDIMANTKIRIMSDELGLDIRPDDSNDDPASKAKSNKSSDKHAQDIKERDSRIQELEEKQSNRANISVGAFATATFLAGIGVGVTVAAVITGTK